MPLVQNESEDGKKSSNAGKAAEKSKVKIDEDACSKIRRCCSLSWSFEPCDAAQFFSLEVTRFDLFTTLESSYYYYYYYSLFRLDSIVYFDTQRNTWKFDFKVFWRFVVKKSYLKVFFEVPEGRTVSRTGSPHVSCFFFFAFWRLSLFFLFFFLLFFLLLNTFSFWMPDLIICNWVAKWFFFLDTALNWSVMRRNCFIYIRSMKFVHLLFKCGIILQNDTESNLSKF